MHKHTASVLTGTEFQNMLRHEIVQISERDLNVLSKFAILGSRRLPDQVDNEPKNRNASYKTN